jgi:hypothetical protein
MLDKPPYRRRRAFAPNGSLFPRAILFKASLRRPDGDFSPPAFLDRMVIALGCIKADLMRLGIGDDESGEQSSRWRDWIVARSAT